MINQSRRPLGWWHMPSILGKQRRVKYCESLRHTGKQDGLEGRYSWVYLCVSVGGADYLNLVFHTC